MCLPKFNFLKVSACGNDFVLIIDFENKYNFNFSHLARIVCRRAFSIGADGLVVLNKSRTSDARMRIFNPDGSEAEMCGNAARCVAKVLVWKKIILHNKVKLRTLAGIITAQVNKEIVKIKMTRPHSFKKEVEVKVGKNKYVGSFINTGVPHTVFFCENIDNVNLSEIGVKVRDDEQFEVGKTNVNFVQIAGKNSLLIRTYERGVEAETLACGTGATASAVTAYLKGLIIDKKINVKAKGGEMKVEIESKSKHLKNVYLASEVNVIYSGEYLGGLKDV